MMPMSKAAREHTSKIGRPRGGKYLSCLTCSSEFYTYQSSKRKYCSHKCSCDASTKKVFDEQNSIKKCAKCHEWKGLDHFQNVNGPASGVHGKQSYCRPCGLIKSNEWAENNKEERRKINHKSYWNNPEKMRAAARGIPKEQRERKNRTQRVYALANSDKVRMWNNARLHTTRAAGKVTREMILKLIALQKDKCAACGIGFNKAKKHLDHIKPVAAGGNNEFGNLQYLCASCNLSKQARDPIEFMQSRGFLL